MVCYWVTFIFTLQCRGWHRRVTIMFLLTLNLDSSTAVRFPRPNIGGSLRVFSFSSSSSSSPSSFRKMPTFFIFFFNGVRIVAAWSYTDSIQVVNIMESLFNGFWMELLLLHTLMFSLNEVMRTHITRIFTSMYSLRYIFDQTISSNK